MVDNQIMPDRRRFFLSSLKGIGAASMGGIVWQCVEACPFDALKFNNRLSFK